VVGGHGHSCRRSGRIIPPYNNNAAIHPKAAALFRPSKEGTRFDGTVAAASFVLSLSQDAKNRRRSAIYNPQSAIALLALKLRCAFFGHRGDAFFGVFGRPGVSLVFGFHFDCCV